MWEVFGEYRGETSTCDCDSARECCSTDVADSALSTKNRAV